MITQSVFQELEKQKAKLSMDQVEEKTNANKIKSQVKRKLKLQMLALEKNLKWEKFMHDNFDEDSKTKNKRNKEW